jgi:hypothetical protein
VSGTKGQTIRAIDVILLGPVLVYSGLEQAASRPLVGYLTAAVGLATVVYNLRNYALTEAEAAGLNIPAREASARRGL